MTSVAVAISSAIYGPLRTHLLQRNRLEQVAFAFAKPAAPSNGLVLTAVEWFPVPPRDFEIQTKYHVELSDRARAGVIKRAHDLDSALVEFHSHPTVGGARFSPSDVAGLDELVPHVRWRLKRRPYFAYVFALDGFDGLAWAGEGDAALQADGLIVDGKLLRASGWTLADKVFHYE
jgi:hypothetical protein